MKNYNEVKYRHQVTDIMTEIKIPILKLLECVQSMNENMGVKLMKTTAEEI